MDAGDLISAFSLIVSIAAIVLTSRQASAAAALERRLDERDRQDINRRFVTTELWDRMSRLNRVKAGAPIAEEIRQTVNTLDFVAICWDADLVDKPMVAIAFGELYDQLYHEIDSITAPLPGLNRTGHELLAQSPTIGRIRAEINHDRQQRAALSKPPKH